MIKKLIGEKNKKYLTIQRRKKKKMGNIQLTIIYYSKNIK